MTTVGYTDFMTRKREYGTGSLYQRSGDGMWIGQLYVGWTPQGLRRKVVVSAKTQAKARRKLDELQAQVRAGHWRPTSKTTVAAWAKKWEPRRATQIRPSSLGMERAALKYIRATLGNYPISSLTAGHVYSLGEAIVKDGKSTTTARRYQTVFLGMLKAAQDEGIEVPPAVFRAKLEKNAQSTRAALPVSDALKLLEAAATVPGYARWIGALTQGLRQGEALGLTWENIDLENGTLTVEHQLQALTKDKETGQYVLPSGYEARQLNGGYHLVPTKSAAGVRVQVLSPWFAAALLRWREEWTRNEWGLVFPNSKGGPRSDRADRAEWAELQTRAKVSKPDGGLYVVHEARHTAATLLLAAGVGPEVIRAILGHSDIVTQEAYKHVDLGMQKDAFTAVGKLLGMDGGGKVIEP